jgi:hypothetical protein
VRLPTYDQFRSLGKSPGAGRWRPKIRKMPEAKAGRSKEVYLPKAIVLVSLRFVSWQIYAVC